jgi:hypothetical protein
MPFSRWKKPRVCCLGVAYIWAVLPQDGQNICNALVLTLVFRDHLNGVGVIRADLLEGSESFVTLLNLWVQGTGDSQCGKRQDGYRTHVGLECRTLHDIEGEKLYTKSIERIFTEEVASTSQRGNGMESVWGTSGVFEEHSTHRVAYACARLFKDSRSSHQRLRIDYLV